MYTIDDKDIPINGEFVINGGRALRVIPGTSCSFCYFQKNDITSSLGTCGKNALESKLICSGSFRNDKTPVIFKNPPIKPGVVYTGGYNKVFFPIGTRFKHDDGTELITVENSGCDRCYFKHVGCVTHPMCSVIARIDNNSVIFIRV